MIKNKKVKVSDIHGVKTKRIINKIITEKLIFLLKVLLFFFLIFVLHCFNFYFNSKVDILFSENYKTLSNEKIINDEHDFSKYKSMLPFLTPDLKHNLQDKEEIFNARQIYISNISITPDYIKYLRPLNKTDEQNYKKQNRNYETVVKREIYSKKEDQYNYNIFSKFALNEQLIKDLTIEYENKPIISIIVLSYNKQNILLKSIRSIQNQNFNNIEIIIVNDCSNDGSIKVFNYLLKSDPRIRIFHHMTNMGVFRSRIDGILYSRGKYIILFDAGDLYEDNYVLLDAYNIIEKYKLDSCKFLFRQIKSFNHLNNSIILWHVGPKSKIEYKQKNIQALNNKIGYHWGGIWNRLVKANIYIKSILLLNELMLNLYKNMWDDSWYNKMLDKVSNSYTIFERVGYVYCKDGQGEGTPRFNTKEEKSNLIREYIGFLYYDFNFCTKNKSKEMIIHDLRKYNQSDNKAQLKNFMSHFEVLNNLLEALIKDPDVNQVDKKFCEKLLNESKIREKNIKNNYNLSISLKN